MVLREFQTLLLSGVGCEGLASTDATISPIREEMAASFIVVQSKWLETRFGGLKPAKTPIKCVLLKVISQPNTFKAGKLP